MSEETSGTTLCCLAIVGSSSFIHPLTTGGWVRTPSTCRGHRWPDKATKSCTNVDIAGKSMVTVNKAREGGKGQLKQDKAGRGP